MVSETHANGSRGRTHHTMALDQSALLDVLDAHKGADVEDRIKQAAATIYQALIELHSSWHQQPRPAGHREVRPCAGGQ